jgi:hypothetical protein
MLVYIYGTPMFDIHNQSIVVGITAAACYPASFFKALHSYGLGSIIVNVYSSLGNRDTQERIKNARGLILPAYVLNSEEKNLIAARTSKASEASAFLRKQSFLFSPDGSDTHAEAYVYLHGKDEKISSILSRFDLNINTLKDVACSIVERNNGIFLTSNFEFDPKSRLNRNLKMLEERFANRRPEHIEDILGFARAQPNLDMPDTYLNPPGDLTLDNLRIVERALQALKHSRHVIRFEAGQKMVFVTNIPLFTSSLRHAGLNTVDDLPLTTIFRHINGPDVQAPSLLSSHAHGGLLSVFTMSVDAGFERSGNLSTHIGTLHAALWTDPHVYQRDTQRALEHVARYLTNMLKPA